MKCIKLCLLLVGILCDLALCQRKVSPCPSVFTYDLGADTSDTWYGTLKLQSSVPLHGITVDVIFDRRAATFGAYYFNDVSTSDYIEYRVENKNFKLDPGRTLVMNVYVRFDNNVPLLKQIRLNGQNICVDIPSTVIQPIYPSNGNSQTDSTTRRTTRRENPNYNYDDYARETSTYRNIFATTTQSWENDFGGSNNGFNSNSNGFNSNSNSKNNGHSGNSHGNSKNNHDSSGNSNSNHHSNGNSNKAHGNPHNQGLGNSNNNGLSNSNNHGSSNSNNNNRDPYESGFSQFSGHETSRPTSGSSSSGFGSNDNDRNTFVNPSSSKNNQNSNNNNQESSFGFVGDSLSGSSNFGNNNQNYLPVTQRPTTSTSNYDFDNNRRTTSTYRPNHVTTKKSTYFQGDLPFYNSAETSTHSILNLDGDSQCGTIIPKVNPLIVHGEETYQGQFPWHAAIYLSEVGSLKYICGGSLVSMNAIVTAAHCVTHEKSKQAINSRNVLAYLGKQSLQKWTGPEQDAKVAEIVVNSEYNPERFYSDIAILKLKDSLTRTNFVRPVCLWNFDNDLKSIVSKLGSVPGWGYNENGLVSEDLSYVKMPVVTHETCIWSNRDFFSKVTSEKSFCAGFRNGTSICNGDSGGGMVFKQGKQYYLRGVVSISIALQNTLKCDTSQYAVFVDASKYTTWIKQNI